MQMQSDVLSGIFSVLMFFIIIAVPILITIWGYNDAEERGQSGCLVALLFLFGGPIGVVIWLVIRNNYPTTYPAQSYSPSGQPSPPSNPGKEFFQRFNQIYLQWKAGEISETEYYLSKDELIDELSTRKVQQNSEEFLGELIPFIESGVLNRDDLGRIRRSLNQP